MNMIDSLYRGMITGDILLAYRGDFSQETVKRILALGEHAMVVAGERPAVVRKVFNVMVESLQNITRHGDLRKHDPEGYSSIFVVNREAHEYSVISGNAIPRTSVPALRTALEQVNNLDSNSLKELYGSIIKGTTISEKGGAGLGLVDMARKSGEKLSFDFPEISETYCFFCLKVNIPRNPNLTGI